MTRNLTRILTSIFVTVCLMFLLPFEAEAAVYGTSDILLHGCDATGNTNTETSFGDLTADAAAHWCDAKIALLPSADFGTNVQPGEVTDKTLEQCLKNNSALAVTLMSANQLYERLEISVSHLTLGADDTIDWALSHFDGYLQISGIRVVCDVSAPIGERIQSIELTDGTPVHRDDTTAQYRVVSTQSVLTGGYGYPALSEEKLEPVGTEREAVAAYIQENGTITEPQMDRFRLQGSRDWIKDNWITMILIFVTVCLIVARLRHLKEKEDVWRSSKTVTAKELRSEDSIKVLEETREDSD